VKHESSNLQPQIVEGKLGDDLSGWVAAAWDRARHPHGVVQPFHVWRLFFLCEITGGDFQTGPETSEVAFFVEHELPAELSTHRVLLAQLKRMFEHMRRPELPTEFD